MKTIFNRSWYISLVIALLLVQTHANAQSCEEPDSARAEPCCNGIIVTDPARAFNPARPGLTNKFEWRDPTWKVFIPLSGGGYVGTGTQPFVMTNPFFTRDVGLSHLNFYRYPSNISDADSLDFHPEDGWELLHKYDGFDSLGTNYLFGGPSLNRPGPYVMLYNRYTGRLRIFASFTVFNSSTDLVETSLGFRFPGNGVAHPSGLLMKNRNIAQPLSEKTTTAEASFISSSASGNSFFESEFDLAYDPCTCMNYSQIKVDFQTGSRRTVSLAERPVEPTESFSGSNFYFFSPEQDFMVSARSYGEYLSSGMYIFKNVDALIARYPEDPSTSEALKATGDIIKSGLSSEDAWLTQRINGEIYTGLSELGLTDISPQTPDKEDKVRAGLQLLGKNSDRLLFPVGDKADFSRPPTPSMIPVDKLVYGFSLDLNDIGGSSSILLRTPGSLGTDESETTSPWYNYPTYNEALGVMAVLDSPEVQLMTGSSRELYPFEEGYNAANAPDLHPTVGPFMRMRFSDLQYVFNPASEVDEEKTVILGALVVKGAPANRTDAHYDYFHDVTTFSEHPSVPNVELVKPLYYLSPFLSLECLRDYVVGDFEPGSEVYLRLMIQYVFKENAYGKVNQSFEILTYPVKFSAQPLPEYSYFPDTLVLDPGTPFNRDTTLKARTLIWVKGNLQIDPGVTLTLVAGGSVKLAPSVNLPPNVKTEVGPQALLGCDYAKLGPVSREELNQFCHSEQYRADQLTSDIPWITYVPAYAYVRPLLKAYPNPFGNYLTLEFALPADGLTNARLVDVLGRQVQVLWENRPSLAGKQIVHVDIEPLAGGMYLVVLDTPNGQKAVRVVKR